MKFSVGFVGIAGAILLGASAEAETCHVYQNDRNYLSDGSCSVEYTDKGIVIKHDKKTYLYKEGARQGVWSFGTLSGAKAARYEHDRTSLSYASTDLNLFIDVFD